MAKIPAPSAKHMLAQATRLWPRRSKRSDGIVPSFAHTVRNPRSDHEPGRAGYCHAVDLTHDPQHGCDCAVISENIVRACRAGVEKRVTLVIFDNRIASVDDGFAWRAYRGDNPHKTHMHVSIRDTKKACEDTSDWPLEESMDKRTFRWVVATVPSEKKDLMRGECDVLGLGSSLGTPIVLAGRDGEALFLIHVGSDRWASLRRFMSDNDIGYTVFASRSPGDNTVRDVFGRLLRRG